MTSSAAFKLGSTSPTRFSIQNTSRHPSGGIQYHSIKLSRTQSPFNMSSKPSNVKPPLIGKISKTTIPLATSTKAHPKTASDLEEDRKREAARIALGKPKINIIAPPKEGPYNVIVTSPRVTGKADAKIGALVYGENLVKPAAAPIHKTAQKKAPMSKL